MDDLFDSFFGGYELPFYSRCNFPAIDIAENEDSVTVNAEVPGCKAEDIDISVHGNTLTISGEKKQETKNQENGCFHVERSYGSFRRDFNLPSDIETTRIEAACKDGILSVTLPKAEKAKPVKIKVKD